MNPNRWFKGGFATTPLTNNSGEGRRMSALRVFLIVVALHAVVLGPILIFEGCKKASSTDQQITESSTPAPDTSPTVQVPEPVVNPGAIAGAPQQPVAPVPQVEPTASPAPPVTTEETVLKTIKVQPGDSLWKIAKAEKVSMTALMQVNNLSEKSVLRVGQELKIPAASATARPEQTAGATTLPAGSTVYVVQPGDSLWGIAKKYNTTVAALREANHLTSNTLKVNQKLVIPPATPQTNKSSIPADIDPLKGGTIREADATYHVVGWDEKLENIAKKYGVTVKDILVANHISDPRTIRVNQRLLIPTKQQPTPAAPAMPEAPRTPVSSIPTPSQG